MLSSLFLARTIARKLKAVLNASSRDFAGVRYGVNVLERSGGAEGLG